MPSIAPASQVVEVRDVMTSRVHTLTMDDSIRSAARLFRKEQFHHVVVLDGAKVAGVLSDRDILKAVSPFVGNPLLERPQDSGTMQRRLHQVMTRNLVTVGPMKSVATAAQTMLNERVSCLPVVDDQGKLIGIVTRRDLVAHLAALTLDEAPKSAGRTS
ncbi:MAG: CBS domain-containing protein [Planctomycetota bacterium]